MASGNGTSSVVVVEIDTRKGPFKTVFESSVANQTEQAIQFWKTLTLSPHIESSLYSKEISQLIKTNPLKPITIDNSRKPQPDDPKTEEYLKQVEAMNRMDEMIKLQKKVEKIENIKLLHKVRKEKSNQLNVASRTALIKSETESRWFSHLNESNGGKEGNDIINENEYEIDENDFNDEELVKELFD
ncbi:unnamed protein product [Brachionus calyciflorus]|uniref:Cilia- and flagella-associated protein HOATZ n=1 Tax=Brachionus calyciflorus TaxID=104777 RepID=A0A813UL92_9BILA|nr:unnamed protein product [Brachionus calyciflorus]